MSSSKAAADFARPRWKRTTKARRSEVAREINAAKRTSMTSEQHSAAAKAGTPGTNYLALDRRSRAAAMFLALVVMSTRMSPLAEPEEVRKKAP